MEKFNESQPLLELQKLSIGYLIIIDDHKNNGQSLEEYLDDDLDSIDKDIYNEIINRNSVVRIQAYLHQNCFDLVIHYDINQAIDNMLERLIYWKIITYQSSDTPAPTEPL